MVQPGRDEPLSSPVVVVALTPALVDQLLPALQEVDAGTMGEPWSREQWLFELPGKWALSLVATIGERPVAFFVASRTERGVHVHRLAVAADLRKRGVGLAIYREACAAARSAGADIFTAKVSPSNERALRVCESVGFVFEKLERGNAILVAPVPALLPTDPPP